MLPPLLVPLFFFAAFTGALSGSGDSQGFGYYDFTAFEFVLVLFMAAMFVGAFTSFDIVDDYESGMGRRLMAGAPRRMAIVAGYLIVDVGRCLLGMALVWGVVLATGMEVRGGVLDIVALDGIGAAPEPRDVPLRRRPRAPVSERRRRHAGADSLIIMHVPHADLHPARPAERLAGEGGRA